MAESSWTLLRASRERQSDGFAGDQSRVRGGKVGGSPLGKGSQRHTSPFPGRADPRQRPIEEEGDKVKVTARGYTAKVATTDVRVIAG
jgi:hypothetical protein